MVMLLLVAAMAILMEYSLSKVILCYQNKKHKSPSTPQTKDRQAGTAHVRGGRVAVTSAQKQGARVSTEAWRRRSWSVCVRRPVQLPSVVMGYAGSCCTVAPPPEFWRRQGDCALHRRASRPQHGFCLLDKGFLASSVWMPVLFGQLSVFAEFTSFSEDSENVF